VAQLVELLSYKLQGSGFDSRMGQWIFHCNIPSGHVTEMRTRHISRGEAAGAYSRQPYHHHVPTVWKSWKPQPLGSLGACPGLK